SVKHAELARLTYQTRMADQAALALWWPSAETLWPRTRRDCPFEKNRGGPRGGWGPPAGKLRPAGGGPGGGREEICACRTCPRTRPRPRPARWTPHGCRTAGTTPPAPR